MKIFILHGPTASGKTLLMNYLLSEDFDYLEPLISFTTRRKRLYENMDIITTFFPASSI